MQCKWGHLCTVVAVVVWTFLLTISDRKRNNSRPMLAPLGKIQIKTDWTTTEFYNKGEWKPGLRYNQTCRHFTTSAATE